MPALPIQYAEYAAWQRATGWPGTSAAEQQADYWKQTLAGAPALLELPADRPRPAQQDYAGAVSRAGTGRGADAASEGVEQAARRDAVYDASGGVGGTAGAAVGPGRLVIGSPVGEPQPGRARAADRLFCEHPGDAAGPVRVARR